MTPAELKRANITRFEILLNDEKDAVKRQALSRLLVEEKAKTLSAYPASTRQTSPTDDGHSRRS